MFRESLEADRGMLFDFGAPQPVTMWMRNTFIPLDMLFIDADGRIARIVAETAAALGRGASDSGEPVRAVLELRGGLTAELGIEPGDRVVHPLFAATLSARSRRQCSASQARDDPPAGLLAAARSRSRRRSGNRDPCRRRRRGPRRRLRSRAGSGRSPRCLASTVAARRAPADRAGAARIDVERALRADGSAAPAPGSACSTTRSRRCAEDRGCARPGSPAVPFERRDRRRLADRARVGGALRLDLGHRPDQLGRAAGIADPPAGHGIGLGDAVHRQAASPQPRLDRQPA